MNANPTLNPFPPASEAEWQRAVEAALKGRDFDKVMVSRTEDGIAIPPLSPRAHPAPIAGRPGGRPWTVIARVDHPDPAVANAQAIEDLEGGAGGLVLVFAGAPQAHGGGLAAMHVDAIDRALSGVLLDLIALRIETAPFQGRAAAAAVKELVARRGLKAEALAIDFGLDPHGDRARTGERIADDATIATRLAEIAQDLMAAGFKMARFCRADGRVIHEGGGTPAQELAFVLASGVAYLRASEQFGISLAEARRLLSFLMAADADQFVTLAKFRALRLMWGSIETACGLEPVPIHVSADTSWRMMAGVDPATNWLRTTLAISGAGLGGADAITVLPHSIARETPDAFARRVARNQQLVLIEEANLHRVGDPAAGAGGIEVLTEALAAEAWRQFQAIEAIGGIGVALDQGLIQRAVGEARVKLAGDIATRRRPLTGVSDFPDPGEAIGAPGLATNVATAGGLAPFRLAEPFEQLRRAAGEMRPRVHLVCLGELAGYSPRAMFAKSLFEAGGFAASLPEPGTEAPPVAQGFGGLGARIACLCGSDEAYAREAVDAARALKEAGALQVWLAGRPGEREDAYRGAGIDGFVFQGADVIAALTAAHRALGMEINQ